MYSEDNFELTSEERLALAALPREMAPGDLLETKVIRALRNEGHFGGVARGSSSRASLVWKIAAAITLFAGGVATGRYALASSAETRASTTAPVTETRDAAAGAPRNETRPVRQTETVVAEREMWL